jgi:hypothetical protein
MKSKLNKVCTYATSWQKKLMSLWLQKNSLEIFHQISTTEPIIHGWQYQTQCCFCPGNNEQSVFGAIEYNHQSYGSRKNDTGVHAKEMYAHFDFENHWIFQV